MNPIRQDAIMELDRLFGGDGPVVVVVHSNPDGDALGSGMAMVKYLRELRGRDAVLIVPNAYADSLAFNVDKALTIVAKLDPEAASRRISECGLIVALDMNEFSRTGDLAETLRSSSAPKVLVDHHLNPSSADFDLVFSDTEVSSASELLYYVLKSMPGAKNLPLDIASSIMVGMTTDTNNFANSVFPSTLQMASELLALGVDRNGILSHLYNEYRPNRFRAMGFCLSDLLTITGDGVAYMVLRESDRARLDLRDGETEGFVNLPLGISEVKMSVFLREDDGYFRVSVRSKPGTSANRFASTFFHGGGHECASGGKLHFPGDIASPGDAEMFLENAAARFMRNEIAPNEN